MQGLLLAGFPRPNWPMGLGPEQRGALSLIKMPRLNRRLLIGPHAIRLVLIRTSGIASDWPVLLVVHADSSSLRRPSKTFGSKKGGGKRPRSKYVGRWVDGQMGRWDITAQRDPREGKGYRCVEWELGVWAGCMLAARSLFFFPSQARTGGGCLGHVTPQRPANSLFFPSLCFFLPFRGRKQNWKKYFNEKERKKKKQ